MSRSVQKNLVSTHASHGGVAGGHVPTNVLLIIV